MSRELTELLRRLERFEESLGSIRQYIGARYVPKFIDDPWTDTIQYEELSVVSVGGTSYISGERVPIGTPISDRNYWHIYGASSGAIINLQNQIDDMNDGDVPGSLQNQINTNASNIEALTNKTAINKVITVSDSYGTGSGGVTPWCTYFKTIMGLANDNFFNWSEGAMGFNKAGHGGHTAQQLMESHESDISDPETVTHIIIGLGLNDMNYTSGLGSAIDSCIGYAHTRYPNAKIYIGFIGNDNAKVYTKYVTALNTYIDRCGKLKAAYITGVENVMHNIRLLQADGTHPTNDGHEQIARYITAFISGGAEYLVQATCACVSEATFTSGITLEVLIKNDIVRLRLNLSYTASSVSLPARSFVKIATITDPVVNGFTGSPLKMCPCMLYDGTNFRIASWLISGGAIYLYAPSAITIPNNVASYTPFDLIAQTIEM